MPNIPKIKQRLEEQLRQLTARAEEIDEDLNQPGDDDWEENAVESAGDEVLEEVGDVTLNEIRQIRRALAKIESGDYGVCSICGGAISKERLEALPYSTRCVSCT